MGSYLLSECRNRPYTAEDAALPRISGEHVVQILPQALVERAGLFPAMDVARQVSAGEKQLFPPRHYSSCAVSLLSLLP